MAVVQIDPTQTRFAKTLGIMVAIALASLAITFILYAGGLLPSAVDPDKAAANWHLKADDYSAALGQKNGWDWIFNLSDGEALSKAALALLGSCILVCYSIAVVSFIKQKNRIYAVLAFLQILILIVAASGLGGGH
jgi:hypothetical protein